ncbi:MAG: hypothetical protein GWO41_09805, partial [candidate division Zixibacteria bacterium]|nr:hypothetical protein [candidate division Zixibacteria bacterium]NIR65949.1 hypothetical protein [candidate division Zixibacteria bacterium]NIS16643.1 hypothetical protein [candidate division Zixibacteria bacterium]NIS47593.1 hypothetical protein [candidate division Zixibacteria bacterium]NIT53013.1 hypothetical protein [candidate division Zixibacteria bacterium]
MRPLVIFIVLSVCVLNNLYIYAQDSKSNESDISPQDSTAIDSANADSASNSHYEVSLRIEEIFSTNKIGQFLQQQRYRLNYSLDSIPEEKIDEYVADMRARRSIKSTVNGIYKPIPMREWPWIMEFSSNVYTGF